MKKLLCATLALLTATVSGDCASGKKGDPHSIVQCLCPLAKYRKRPSRTPPGKRVVYVHNTTSSPTTDGSRKRPFTSIEAALTAYPDIDIVAIIGTTIPYTIANTIVLGDDQALMSLSGPSQSLVKPRLQLASGISGIELGERSRVSGLIIEGDGSAQTGIISSAAGTSSCAIEENDFVNISTAISCLIAPAGEDSGVEIAHNAFTNATNGVLLTTQTGARAAIRGNSFTNARKGISEIADASSLGSFLTVENNSFDNAADTAIAIFGASEVSLTGNRVYNSPVGMRVAAPTTPDSVVRKRVTATENECTKINSASYISDYELAVVVSNIFSCNNSSLNVAALQLTIPEAGSACVQYNAFTDNLFYGLKLSSEAATTSCVQLLDNKANVHGLGFDINNNSPVHGPLNINETYRSRNSGSVAVGSNVTTVSFCSVCDLME